MGKANVSARSAAAIGGLMCVSSALATNGVLGQYQDLGASYDAPSGVLTIYATNEPGLQSAGFVREMGAPGRTAIFGPGFVAEPNPASFDASLTLSDIGDGSASVSGQVVVTDVDGDTMTLGIDGYAMVFGQAEASVMGLTLWVGVNSDEALFDGTDGGQVPTGFALDSAVLTLFVRRDPRNGEGLFHASFSDGRASTVFAIPAPGVGAVLVVGAAWAARRRRVA